jgi:primase-polymerase (primpol)-like protein
MAAHPHPDPTVFTLSRFQASASDLRQTVEHLQEVEEEMTATLQEMYAQAHPRERLMVAEAIVAGLRTALTQLN